MAWILASSMAPVDRWPSGEGKFAQLLVNVWRRKWWIVGVTAVSLLVAAATVGFFGRRYTSEAIVRPVVEQNDESAAGAGPAAPLVSEVINSQVQLLTSRELAQRAIDELGLIDNPEFNPLSAGLSPFDKLLIRLGVETDPRKISPEEQVFAAYYDRLQVSPVEHALALRIKFSASNPELAAKAANAIAELYLSMRGQPQAEAAAAHGERNAGPGEALDSKVAELDRKIKVLREQSGLSGADDKRPMTEGQLADLTKQLEAARKSRADLQGKANLTEDLIRRARYSAIPEIAGDEALRRVASKSAALHDQFALEGQTYLPQHPRMRELRDQIAYVDNTLRTAAEKVAHGLENESRVAGARVETLEATLNSHERMSKASKELIALQNDAAAARQELDAYRAKTGEIAANGSSAASPGGVSLISRAVPSRLPSLRKDIKALVVSAFGGLLLSFGAVVGHELFRGANASHRDRGAERRPERAGAVPIGDYAALPSALGIRPAAMPMPLAPAGSIEAVARQSREPLGISALAMRIEPLKPETRAAAVLVCGLDAAAASSVAALEILKALARRTRATLVDVEGEGRGLAGFIAGHALFDAANPLAGRILPGEALRRDLGSPPVLGTAGAANGIEKIDPQILDAAIDGLIATRDYVILNGPPLESGDRSLGLAGWVDMVVLVASGVLTSPDALAAVDKLVDAGAMNVQLLTGDDEG